MSIPSVHAGVHPYSRPNSRCMDSATTLLNPAASTVTLAESISTPDFFESPVDSVSSCSLQSPASSQSSLQDWFASWFKPKPPSERDVQLAAYTVISAVRDHAFGSKISEGLKRMPEAGVSYAHPHVRQAIQENLQDKPETLQKVLKAYDSVFSNDASSSSESPTDTVITRDPLKENYFSALTQGGAHKVTVEGLQTDFWSHGISLDCQNEDGRTAAHVATRNTNVPLAAFLTEQFDQGNCDLYIEDSIGMSPLRSATFEGKPKVVEAFLKSNKLDPNHQDSDGMTPLAEAVLNSRELSSVKDEGFACLKILLQNPKIKPNTLLGGDHAGKTAIDLALETENPTPIIQIFKKYGNVSLTEEQQKVLNDKQYQQSTKKMTAAPGKTTTIAISTHSEASGISNDKFSHFSENELKKVLTVKPQVQQERPSPWYARIFGK